MIRRLIGLICAIISIVFLVAIVLEQLPVFTDAFNLIKETPGEWWGVLRSTVVLFFEALYKPLVVLLLSAISMGKYSK